MDQLHGFNIWATFLVFLKGNFFTNFVRLAKDPEQEQLDPDPQKMNADPKPCLYTSMTLSLLFLHTFTQFNPLSISLN